MPAEVRQSSQRTTPATRRHVVPPPPRRGTAGAAVSVMLVVALSGCAGMSDPTGLIGSRKSQGSGDASGATPAATSPAALPDLAAESGPAAPTAVVEETFTLDGAILPVARGQSRVETRADRRRSDGSVTFDNWLMRQFAPDGRTADIVRLDRSLVWTLAPSKRQYTECPLTGCRSASARSGEPTAQEPAEQGRKPTEPSCPVTLKAADLKVDGTGERRTINGFATERFIIDWTVQLADRNGGSNTNRVRLELWTTPETGAIKEVQAIQETFQRRHASALARADSPVARYLPRNVSNAMASMMRNIDANDQRTLGRWATEMKKVRGYPIATTMNWTTEGAICSGEGGAGASPQATAAGIGSVLGGMLGGRKADGSAAPLISFSQEVRTVAVKPIADAVFSPPADYARSN